MNGDSIAEILNLCIGDFIQAAEKINTLHSFMIVRHGQVVAEAWWKPEAPDKLHKLASLTKSFISKLERAKVTYALDREELRTALTKVVRFVERLLEKLKGSDAPAKR